MVISITILHNMILILLYTINLVKIYKYHMLILNQFSDIVKLSNIIWSYNGFVQLLVLFNVGLWLMYIYSYTFALQYILLDNIATSKYNDI